MKLISVELNSFLLFNPYRVAKAHWSLPRISYGVIVV
jgi:hypothetical protein